MTASDDHTARIWNLDVDETPILDLVKLAELNATARIDETGTIQTLTLDELRSHFTEMKAKYPTVFAGPGPAQIKTWHTGRLAEADAANAAFASAFHLRILHKFDPGNTDLKAKLAAAEAQLMSSKPSPPKTKK